MEENKANQENNIIDTSIKQLKENIQKINEECIQPSNIDFLYRSVDIYKDFLEIKEKEENMRYRGYGNDSYSEGSYGRRGVAGTGRGRYRDGGSFGRRYRGEDMLDEMYEGYGEYMEGGYSGEETTKALKYMLKSAEDFFRHIQEEAQSPEEIEMVKKTAKRISEM